MKRLTQLWERLDQLSWPATGVVMLLFVAIVATVGGRALAAIAPRSAEPTATPEIVYLYRAYLPLLLKDEPLSPTPSIPYPILPTPPVPSPFVYTFPDQPTPAATIAEIDLMARTLACETQIFFDEDGQEVGTGSLDAIAIVELFGRRREILRQSWEEVILDGSSCWTESNLPLYLVSRRDFFCESRSMSFQECRLMLEIASGAMYGWYEDLMPGATHFYDSQKLLTPPPWADDLDYVGSIGPHKYYKVWLDTRR